MTRPTGRNALAVSEEGLARLRDIHEMHARELAASARTLHEITASLATNPFGAGDDGAAALKAVELFSAALSTGVRHEQASVEKLWGNFQLWARLVSDADGESARGIGNTVPHEGR